MFTLGTAAAAAASARSDLHLSDESLISEDVGDDLFISLTSRWAIYITSLFCLSFSFHSHFSICLVYPLIFFFLLPARVRLFLSLFCSLRLFISLYILSHKSLFHSPICFLRRTLRLTNCVCLADPASVFVPASRRPRAGLWQTEHTPDLRCLWPHHHRQQNYSYRIHNSEKWYVIYTDVCPLTASNKLGNYTHNCTKILHRRRTNWWFVIVSSGLKRWSAVTSSCVLSRRPSTTTSWQTSVAV